VVEIDVALNQTAAVSEYILIMTLYIMSDKKTNAIQPRVHGVICTAHNNQTLNNK